MITHRNFVVLGVLILAMVGAFAFGAHRINNATSDAPQCYRILVDDYAVEKPLIDKVMADGRLTNGECTMLQNAGSERYQAERQADNAKYINEYQALKAGKKLPEDDDQ